MSLQGRRGNRRSTVFASYDEVSRVVAERYAEVVFSARDDVQLVLDANVVRVLAEGNAEARLLAPGPVPSRSLRQCQSALTRLGSLLPESVRADRIDEWVDDLACARECDRPVIRRALSIMLWSLPIEVWRLRVLRAGRRQEA